MKTNTEISFSFWLTLFYSIPLLAFTHRQNDWLMEERIHSLRVGWRNLPTLCVGWRNLFFQLCCRVSFWFWREMGFGCTYYYLLGVPYNCGVVLVFLVLAGNSFWCYVIRIRMIDCTHTNSYVVTHMYHFIASTKAPYLDFFINITCQRFLPSYLEAEARKWDEIQIRMIDWPNTNSYVVIHMY
jgi:hypothetical protein